MDNKDLLPKNYYELLEQENKNLREFIKRNSAVPLKDLIDAEYKGNVSLFCRMNSKAPNSVYHQLKRDCIWFNNRAYIRAS